MAQQLTEVNLGALEGELKSIERTVIWNNTSGQDVDLKFWSTNRRLVVRLEQTKVLKGERVEIPVSIRLPDVDGDHELELRLLTQEDELLNGYLFKFKKLAAVSYVLEAYKNEYWPFRAKENVFNLKQGYVGENLEASFNVLNFSGEELDLGQVVTNNSVKVKFEPSLVPHNGFTKMYISLKTDSLSLGFSEERIDLYANKKLLGSIPLQYTLTEKPNSSTLNEPKISLSRLSHNFKVIQVGDRVKTTFRLRNSGGKALEINGIESNCECLSYELPKRVLAIGETIELEAVFDATKRIGLERKTLAIFSNDPLRPTQVITIRAHVK